MHKFLLICIEYVTIVDCDQAVKQSIGKFATIDNKFDQYILFVYHW